MLRAAVLCLPHQQFRRSVHPTSFVRLLSAKMIMARTLEQQITILKDYGACDVSDALLKLQKPAAGKAAKAGYLADIVPYAPSSPLIPGEGPPKVIAPATTLKLMDKSDPSPTDIPESNQIPKGSHWADETEAGTVFVIEQPRHQTCACVGGIMASRMKHRGVLACVVAGRVRDLPELKASQLPIWAAGPSTVGTGAEAKVYARNIPLVINDVEVKPNDIIFCDPLAGVVVIPQDLVDNVIELMSTLVEADDKVKEDVDKGISVMEAFKKHRG